MAPGYIAVIPKLSFGDIVLRYLRKFGQLICTELVE